MNLIKKYILTTEMMRFKNMSKFSIHFIVSVNKKQIVLLVENCTSGMKYRVTELVCVKS